jgi:hypothetical protein
VPRAGRVPRGARGLGPGLRRVVLRPPAAPLPSPHGGRVATSASPVEVAAYRLLPARVARLPPRTTSVLCRSPQGAAPARSSHRAGTPAHRPACTCTSGPSTTRRDEALLDRGVDGLMTDRTDILRAVLTESGRWEDTCMTADEGNRRPEAAVALQGPESRYWYDWANSAFYTTCCRVPVCAVHDRPSQATRPAARIPMRRAGQDGQPARPRPGAAGSLALAT